MDIIKYYGSDETKTDFINHDSEPLMACLLYTSLDRLGRGSAADSEKIFDVLKENDVKIITLKKICLLYTSFAWIYHVCRFRDVQFYGYESSMKVLTAD